MIEWSASWEEFAIASASVVAFFVGYRLHKPRAKSAALLFLFSLLSLLLVLGDPYWVREREERALTLLVDISESMETKVGDELLTRARSLASESNSALTLLPFSGKGGAPFQDSGQSYASLRNSYGRLDLGHSNIEHALRGGSATAAPILLLSDGWENQGNALNVQSMFEQSATALYPLTPPYRYATGEHFGVHGLEAPLVAPAGKSVDIRVSLENTTTERRRGVLVVTHHTKEILRKSVVLEPGKESLEVVPSDPSQEGIKEITATITPEENYLAPTSRTLFLTGEARERVLLINGSPDDQRYLPTLLRDQSYQLTSVAPHEVTASVEELDRYSVVIFNNVARNQLSSSLLSKISPYVERGGGFLMIGGNQSFGLGGYMRSPIEELLPVTMLPPQTMEKRVNVAVQLVLDKSASMAQGSKLEFAKEAAREVVRNLKDEDYVGIIGFDDIPWIVVKLGLLRDIRDTALERVGRLFPTRKTNLLPAIDEARRALTKAPAGRKHMIILTDGKVPDGGPFYLELVKDMRVEGITVSTVMMGGETDTDMLRQMASLGGGAFYQTMDPSTLPKIFLADVKTRSGERTLKEQQEYTVRIGTGDLSSTTLRSFPPLRGYVQTKRKEGANLELVALGNDGAEPLLASWKVGKGSVVAYTSDANARWSAPWFSWEGIARFYTELIDSLRPHEGDPRERVEFSLQHMVVGDTLSLDLSIFTERAAHAVTGSLVLPNGEEKKLSFESVQRGRFLGELRGVVPGRYEFRGNAGGRTLPPVALYLSGDLFGEKKGAGFNVPLLNALASISKGKINPGAEDLQNAVRIQRERIALSSWLFLLSACLFLSGVILRERGYLFIKRG